MNRKLLVGGGLAALAALLGVDPALAQETTPIDRSLTGDAESIFNAVVLDNIFIFVCAVLVFMMQAGFGLVEAGLTRAKNAGNIMMKNLMDVSIGVLVFAAVGWGIAYPGDFSIGSFFGFAGMGVPGFNDPLTLEALAEQGDDFYSLAIPVDFFFQAAFAATAATIVSGAVAGRTNFKAYLVYSVILTGLIYPIVVSWQWGGGWLSEAGMEDFAGSGLVHMTGGIAAFMGAMALGPRIGKYTADGKPRAIPGHSIPLAITGVFILFIGWFGFNPGSELAADMAVPQIAVKTLLAACAGSAVSMIVSWIILKKPDVSMSGNGLLAGLVAICSGVGAMNMTATIITGAVAGGLVVVSVLFVERTLKIDDPVGAFSLHGVCGAWGLIATGLMVSEVSIGAQLQGVFGITVFVAVTMGAVFYAMKAIGILRVSEEDEMIGLDISEHGAPGYGPDIMAPSAGSGAPIYSGANA